MGTTPSIASPKPLQDRFGRHINYLRVSVTDRCDFRCIYCMNEKTQFTPRSCILTLEEIAFIIQAFSLLGVSKVRITGGEPLVRNNLSWLIKEIQTFPELKETVLTTNGSQLQRLAPELRQAGIKRINISLDTLRPERFKKISRIGHLETVLHGIETCKQLGFQRLRLNTVIMKNINHDEILDLVHFAIQQKIDIAFIEEMPLGNLEERNRADTFYSNSQIKQDLEQRFTLHTSTASSGGPAKYFQIENSNSKVGFISPHSHNFCQQCNRVRLTTDGRLLLCLGQEHSVDLKAIVRAHPGRMDVLQKAIVAAMAVKPFGHEFNLNQPVVISRHMNVSGG
ncbi:MAG: GTP 3',8-cyclase MoaA [Gammaproteobacteria bacterium]|nr:GTP 3',8-cyclase MoaA [Gammaproteobacteria bacterium]MDH5800407.1 GTP 3',8-cyclase MoaA [Gammaproteobacteria bacterium]